MIIWRRVLAWLLLPLELTVAFSVWLVSWRTEVRGFLVGFLAGAPQNDDIAQLAKALDYLREHSPLAMADDDALRETHSRGESPKGGVYSSA